MSRKEYMTTQKGNLKKFKDMKQMWYATMCDGDGELLEQCNIVRALHRIPKWEKLPDGITKNE